MSRAVGALDAMASTASFSAAPASAALNRRLAAMALVLGATALPATAQQPRVVRATNAPVWGPAPRLVEEVRIGALDGAEEYVFGRVSFVAVADGATVFVADTQVPVIRMYDALGSFVRNVGGAGEGPGEYRRIGGMEVLRDGRLAVWDNRVGRITLFTPAGEYDSSHTVTSGFFSADVFQVDHDGRFYVRAVVRDANDPRERQGEVWIRLSAGGEVLDSLPIPEEPSTPPSFVLSTASGYDRPFTRQLITTLSPLGYLVVGHNRAYAFELRRTEEPTLRIERPFTPLPVRGPEHAEWEAWAEFFARAGSGGPSYSVPDTKPAFSTLRTDAGGRIWVRRYVEAVHRPRTGPPSSSGAPPREWREQPTWDVFEPTGTFLGTVVLPANAYFYDAVDRHVWATVRGEFDEAYVVRFRIEPGDR